MIQLLNVSKRFAEVTAVDDVSLSVAKGEFLTLLGPSGCGKTTLLRMISGFERPDAGKILLDTKDVTDVPPYRRDVNQVFQSYALFSHLNVRENVAFGLKAKGIAKPEIPPRVAQAIELVALSGLEKRKPAELSGGQRQRVALARAIVNRPQVLLLDEPLAALDAKLRQTMQIELKQLQRKLGITFVFVTHDQSEALVLSDRIAVMNHGKVEQIASPIDIYHHPATPFVAGFVGEGNLWRIDESGPGWVRTKDLQLNVQRTGDWVLVRPEQITLQNDGPSQGTITEIFFAGAQTRIHLLTDAGLPVRATVGGKSTLAVGDRVSFTISPSDAVVLPTSAD